MERSILLVDDDERLLSGLIRAMHKQPFQILTARNGQEALWILKTHRIEVIISDERMPGIPGTTLLAWVAEHCPDTVRIVLTGHADIDVAIRAINEGGVRRFFIKPCNEARLAMAIHSVIEENDAREQMRQQMECSRERLEFLERNHEALASRTRSVSENLQNLLSHIDECCRLLEEHWGDRLDGDAQSRLGDARNAAAEARRLASQLESEKQEVEPASCPTA